MVITEHTSSEASHPFAADARTVRHLLGAAPVAHSRAKLEGMVFDPAMMTPADYAEHVGAGIAERYERMMQQDQLPATGEKTPAFAPYFVLTDALQKLSHDAFCTHLGIDPSLDPALLDIPEEQGNKDNRPKEEVRRELGMRLLRWTNFIENGAPGDVQYLAVLDEQTAHNHAATV